MIGFIGGGNMAEALIKGMTAQRIGDIVVSEPKEKRRNELHDLYGVRTAASNREVVALCRIIVLAVKPQIMDEVLDEIGPDVSGEKTVVSIAAGITLPFLESKLATGKIVRVMPNTPALAMEGMSVLSVSGDVPESDVDEVKQIFMSVGKVMELPEEQMNTVTALSGSGPAFLALFVEALIEAGASLGLDRQCSEELAVQTMLGTAKLLDSGMSPRTLREMVTSPGGTTAAGLNVFAEKDLTGIAAAALAAAETRARELGKKG